MKSRFPNRYWAQWSAEYNRLIRAGHGHAAAYLKANALVAAIIADQNSRKQNNN